MITAAAILIAESRGDVVGSCRKFSSHTEQTTSKMAENGTVEVLQSLIDTLELCAQKIKGNLAKG